MSKLCKIRAVRFFPEIFEITICSVYISSQTIHYIRHFNKYLYKKTKNEIKHMLFVHIKSYFGLETG